MLYSRTDGKMIEIIMMQVKMGRAAYPVEVILDEYSNGDKVSIELTLEKTRYIGTADNYFIALKELRIQMERADAQIICNGAAKNVYPSPMMMSMGNGRKAYVIYHGVQARMTDVVDIFDTDFSQQACSVREQEQYYTEWLTSLRSNR